VEENVRLELQVFQLGEVLLASCACEAQVDLILNLESRTNAVDGDMFLGYDWSSTCGPEGDGYVCGGKPVTRETYDRMVAQVRNDAAGWDAPENLAKAMSEPADPDEILGNFTHEELPGDRGFALPVGIGHAGDYNGYTVSYREYMSRDHYRKALTAYGPHTADYMVTRLVRMAGSLRGGPPLAPEPHDVAAQADELRQEALARAIGGLSGPAYDAWRTSLPADLGPVEPVSQPAEQLTRFGAATFTWRGGSNAVDNPVVRVERLVDGAWREFADMSGEVQTQLAFPRGVSGVADAHTGSHEWLWTAAFEAYSAFPARLGSTPDGTYRFVVGGTSRVTGEDAPYALTSQPFQVVPWTGVQVSDGRVDASGDTSFRIGDSAYPRTWPDRDQPGEQPDGLFPTIRDDHDNDGRSAFCRTCSFRPWAQTAQPVSAVVTVTRADGRVEEVAAALGADGRWHAETALQPGDAAVVAPGGVRDEYGETNGTPLVLAAR
jgi:hypothetical protein